MSKRSLPVLNGTPGSPSSTSDESSSTSCSTAAGELPKLYESFLDWDDLDCVLADLDDFVECLQIQERDKTGQVSEASDLFAARERFLSGVVESIQITYRFADDTWIDTIVREAEGASLMRIAAPR